MESITNKPPLSVKPETIWRRQRMLDLSQAMHDYLALHISDGRVNFKQIDTWLDDLCEHVRWLGVLKGDVD